MNIVIRWEKIKKYLLFPPVEEAYFFMKVAQMAFPYKIVCIEDKPAIEERVAFFSQILKMSKISYGWILQLKGQMNVIRSDAIAKF